MTTKQTARAHARGRPFGLDTQVGFPAWQSNALDIMTRAGQAYAEGVAAIGEEMASFMQTRLQHNMALGDSLTRCHTWTDVAEVQRDWLKEATEEYAAESQKLMEMGSKLMRESWAPVEQVATEAVETEPKASKQD